LDWLHWDPLSYAVDPMWSDWVRPSLCVPCSGKLPCFTSNSHSKCSRAPWTFQGPNKSKGATKQVAGSVPDPKTIGFPLQHYQFRWFRGPRTLGNPKWDSILRTSPKTESWDPPWASKRQRMSLACGSSQVPQNGIGNTLYIPVLLGLLGLTCLTHYQCQDAVYTVPCLGHSPPSSSLLLSRLFLP